MVVDRVSISERINQLIDRIEAGGGSFRFDACLDLSLAEPELRSQLVVTLLAVLELARLKVVRVLQSPDGETLFVSQIAGSALADARRAEVTSAAEAGAEAANAEAAGREVAGVEGAVAEVANVETAARRPTARRPPVWRCRHGGANGRPAGTEARHGGQQPGGRGAEAASGGADAPVAETSAAQIPAEFEDKNEQT